MKSFQELQDLYHHPKIIAFQRLLEPCSSSELEKRARESEALTRSYFGKTMRLFAPLYLSNECINSCLYCGFSRENPIFRLTLSAQEVKKEAQFLLDQGMRNILLVAGEHPRHVSLNYLKEIIKELNVPSLSLEVAPLEQEEYQELVEVGVEGLVVYQETYQPEVYQKLHLAGPKKDFFWRLQSLERGYHAGFKRLGLGALFGLVPWKEEARSLAAHLFYLQKECWKSQLTVSLPRLRPAAGGFQPEYALEDRDFLQLLFALRVTFPQVHLLLSTREEPAFRDALIPFGVTIMSAGSHTEPGGYTEVGGEKIHQTVRGKEIASPCKSQQATEQFEIADHRSIEVIAQKIRDSGLDPVWKDWDEAILTP